MTNDSEIQPNPSKPAHKPLSRLALGVLAFAILVTVIGVMAGFGSRWGLWNFRTGFSMLRWAAYGGILTIALGAVALYRARPNGPRRGLAAAAAALLLGLLVVGVPWLNQRAAAGAPPIHDITTDTENPPPFVAVAPLRADAPNPVEYGGEETAVQQRRAFPEIRPVILDLPADRAFQRALDAAAAQGWEIVDANPADGRIEATDRTFWFGFYDDVVIRLTPLDGRTVLDVRSKSRIGRGDMGTNARRVREYIAGVVG